MATIPPGDFYDCLFLYFSCTDYEKPEWPGNKEKCTSLFDYCITYTEKHANSTEDNTDPFVTKIPISSEIITEPTVSSTLSTDRPRKPSSEAPSTSSVPPTSSVASTTSSSEQKPSESSSTESSSENSTTDSTTSSPPLAISESSSPTSESEVSTVSIPAVESTSTEPSLEAEEPSETSDVEDEPEPAESNGSATDATQATSSAAPLDTTSQASSSDDDVASSNEDDVASPTSPLPEASSSESSEDSQPSETPIASTVSTESTTESTSSEPTPATIETTASSTQQQESSSTTKTSTTTEEVATEPATVPTTASTTSSTTSSTPSTTSTTTTLSTTPSTSSTTTEPPTTTTEKSTTVKAENQNAIISGLPGLPKPPPRPKKKPASCADLYNLKGIRESGTYPILVAGKNVTVYCDMETRGGGWTVLQRRGDFGKPDDYFLRKWAEYKNGFGNPEEDHWIGLKFWNNITLSTPQQLLIEMEDWFGNKTEIVVNNFIIGTEFFKFRIIYASIDGEFGESLPKKGTKFSTLDNDNDAWRNNCASRFKGAWWYSACHNSNLNGLYLKGEHESFGNGVNWYHWTGYHYSLKKTEMKVRVQSKAVKLGFLDKTTPKPSGRR